MDVIFFTHQKESCLKEGTSKTQFYCKICIPESFSRTNYDHVPLVTNNLMIKVDGDTNAKNEV